MNLSMMNNICDDVWNQQLNYYLEDVYFHCTLDFEQSFMSLTFLSI